LCLVFYLFLRKLFFLFFFNLISSYQASKDDITVYSALPSVPSAEFVNVARWYKHIDALLRIS
jgi:elongation factor 1-beta